MNGAGRRALAGLIAMDAIEPDPDRIGAIGILIAQGCVVALVVPFLAGHGTSLTPDAGVEVDDQPELALAGARAVGKGGHGRPSRPRGRGRVPGGRSRLANCGRLIAAGATFSTRTRRSYQAAWPVTGSQLA